MASCAGSQDAAVGKRAPDWTLASVDGKTVELAALRGQAVYLNFFATWCDPCKAEAPSIDALARRYAPAGLRVVGIDEQESTAKARSFVEKLGLTYAVAADEGRVGDRYHVNGLPLHVFIKRDGTIATIRAGEMTEAAIEKQIRALL